VPLPVARPDIKGLINLRGETVSVLSLDNILGNIKKPKYLVICEHDGRSFGFEVEEAERVLVVQQSDLQELPNGQHHFGHKKNISHVVHFEDKQVMILNLTDVIAA
jgi:chemotaxis signal transduction protein